jgi:sorbitol/mannitol transport system substrate-binding protein
MKWTLFATIGVIAIAIVGPSLADTTLTIATVNNGDMIQIQKLTDDFKKRNPGIDLDWVTVEENVLRKKVTTNVATKAGLYDVLTIGIYEAPIWARQGRLAPLSFGVNYDIDDLLPPIRSALSYDGKLYAAPFYGESSMLMYRKDLFAKAGLATPAEPSWDFIKTSAARITNKDDGIYGICLRGKAGWGENMAFLTTMANSYSGRWFNEKWEPEFTGPEWKTTLETYLDLMKNYGPPDASSNGYNENLACSRKRASKVPIWARRSSRAPPSTRRSSRERRSMGRISGARRCGQCAASGRLACPCLRLASRCPIRSRARRTRRESGDRAKAGL